MLRGANPLHFPTKLVRKGHRVSWWEASNLHTIVIALQNRVFCSGRLLLCGHLVLCQKLRKKPKGRQGQGKACCKALLKNILMVMVVTVTYWSDWY